MADWPPWLTITLDDLTDTTRAVVLYTSLCGCGLLDHGAAWMDDELQLAFLALVEYALDYGKSPVALLRWLLHNPGRVGIGQRQTTQALERLQAYHIALSTEVLC